ncbi:hypothetical protein [Hyphococcus sp.]|uniref:hypothetical protein n=1 Tax=Hyphococcus sp. TaxID=2038636 RepID=UPI00208257C7|nr:MAG: hypothetical protein DHS20C04_11640 [Marinicaulis sp.]
MIRIFLPLAIVAAIFFGPMFSVETKDPVRGESMSTVTGDYFIGNAVECIRQVKLPVGDECATEGRMNDSMVVGSALSWASVLAGLAAVLAIPGMLPFIGRITSIVTVASGLAALGALGLFLTNMLGSEAGLAGVQWGAYLAAGLALLTTISGLSGMRGR